MGIYGRTDIEGGVHKAPANEVLYGLTRFEVDIVKSGVKLRQRAVALHLH